MFAGNYLAALSIPRSMQVSIRIALGLIFGIVVADQVSSFPALVACLCAVVLVLLWLPRVQLRVALIAALMGGSALSYTQWSQRLAEDRHRAHLDHRETLTVQGWVEGMPLRRPGRQQLLLHTQEARIWLTIYSEPDSEFFALVPGQELRVHARLRSPVGLRGLGTVDRRRLLMARSADLVGSASADEVVILGQRWSPWSLASRVHGWAFDAITKGEDRPEGRAIVAALATGDRAGMSESLGQAVRATGVAHLLAVSGMHLAALVTLVFLIVLRAWAYSPWHQRIEPRALAASVALLAALAFTAMTGARPSTCRALVVATFLLVGMIIDRRIRLLHALAWSASILLLWRPVLLWDVGFQLSFAATTALALAFSKEDAPLHFAKPTRGRRIRRGVVALCRASFWATLATYPISLYHFGEVSWIGLASNLLAVPFTTMVLLPTALGGLALLALWPGAGQALLEFAVALAQWLADFCFWIEAWVPLVVRAPLNALELACWGVAMLALLLRSPRLSRRVRLLTIFSACALLLLSRLLAGPMAQDSRRDLRITFVEIGQGDAAVIETPGGEVWLVDGGGLPFVGNVPQGDWARVAETPARQALLPYLRHRRIQRIDLAIISHPHPDHFVGLQAVSRRMPIKEIWTAHSPRANPGSYEQWLALLAARGSLVRTPPLGKARSVAGAQLHVLWPRYTEPDRNKLQAPLASSDPILTVNDNSLVVRLDFAGRRILFAGDIEEEAEELLVSQHLGELRSDVVKVPHHGSPTSSTEAFVSATSPSLAVISCGRGNHFGFPDAEVVERWRERSPFVLRTDLVGSVTLRVHPDGRMHVSTNDAF